MDGYVVENRHFASLKNALGLLFLFAVLPLALGGGVANGEETPLSTDVHWCSTIPAFRSLQEAQFSAVYVFDLGPDGHPIHIRQASVPFIAKEDGLLVECIAGWHIPSTAQKGSVVFRFHWGWKDLYLSTRDVKMTIPVGTQALKTHTN